ncbi:MAG TPA: GH116 family glycosyl hydrolase [Vicinamibacterales bacterium]|nr:GH116 family glycosyl hydrolase [Vicinamibacterales bacterium]
MRGPCGTKLASAVLFSLVAVAGPSTVAPALDKFVPSSSGLSLARPITPGAFFDVVGRRAAVFGYEDRPFEVWVYPLKILDDFSLAFALEGYPLDIAGRDIISAIQVRPEATVFTYSHAAFTVRQTIVAPLDEPGAIVLLDIDTTLPIRVTASFRPRLRLMWPAGSMTPNVGWDVAAQRYTLTEESGRFAAVVGSPGARDLTLMPYQEEPRDVPLRFVRELSAEDAAHTLVPIVIAGSVKGRQDAEQAYERLLGGVPALYERNVTAYRDLLDRTTDVEVPDARLTEAFRWAKVGTDKGMATNPALGTGLVAGFRTSGESERPGFAWFFGRDALWTTLALDAYGDFASTRTALEFLAKHQRADGKIPHEVSQSAAYIPWFDAFPYAWASADATPLFVVAHAEHWRATGDRAFLERSWKSIANAYRFTSRTDTDGNGLVENTTFGHGWVEGGALYPPHEEIYQQGLWMAALEGIAEMAQVMKDASLSAEARASATKTREATEARYWLQERGHYAFATKLPTEQPREAEPGPSRERRQQRLNELRGERLIDEDTVLPAVPLWWGLLQEDRADRQIDRLGSGDLATDWGARILSRRSRLYDPLSYHYGSVWPLFTGWASMAAYRYGRPHVGFQALMANALLTAPGALGYVTELLSGDYNAPFGRSSHHQVWSEAMVVTPLVRGLLGIEVRDGGATLRMRPQLPADWDRVVVRRIAAGGASFDATIVRTPGRVVVEVQRSVREPGWAGGPQQVEIGFAFPLDAETGAVTVNGRGARPLLSTAGDVRFAQVTAGASDRTIVEYRFTGGSDVYVRHDAPGPGDTSRGLRVLRSRAGRDGLRLTLEGRGGQTYSLGLRTTRALDSRAVEGVKVERRPGQDPRLMVTFDGPADEYARREVLVPLSAR